MVKWSCTTCGLPADYHSCVDGVHKYHCDKHWWEYVKTGYVVQNLGSDDVSIAEDVGMVKEGSCELHKEEMLK